MKVRRNKSPSSVRRSGRHGYYTEGKMIREVAESKEVKKEIDEEKFARDKERGSKAWAGIDPVKFEKDKRK